MAITNNLLPQVDLPVWEWMRFAPATTSALTCLTTARDGKNKYLFYISGTTLFRYDTRADSWQTLSIGGSVTNAVAAQYVNNQGFRGQVISSTTNTVQLPSIGTSTVGYKIKIISGVGIGQERTIISNNPEVVHDSGIVTGVSTSVIADSTKKWKFNQWEGYGARVMLNGGFGQTREVLYNDTTSLTLYDVNYEGRDYMTVPYNTSFPYSALSTTAGSQTGYSIVSQVVTIDSNWTVQPDKSSKFRIDSDGIWILSGNNSAPFYNLFYYDILSDRWVQKVTGNGLFFSSIGTDISITPTTNIISNFILKGVETSSSPTTVTSQSITDSTLSLTPGSLVGCSLRITTGTGLGQERRITGNTDKIFTLSNNWDILPATSSTYVVTAENSIYVSGNNSTKLYKYYPEQSVWTQGNLVDNGIVLTMALLRMDPKQHHGVTTATVNASGITSVSTTPIVAGTGYVVGELITLSGGSSNGRVIVETISNIGSVLSVSLYTAGTNYTTGTKTQTATTGVGTGLQINIATIGRVASITTAINHDLQIGDVLTFAGASVAAWNTSMTIIGIQAGTVVEAITTATTTAVAKYPLATNLVVDVSKNWIPNQHAGKILGIQSNGINGTLTYRKIIGNSNNTISFTVGVTPTNGNSRYFIQDLEALGDSETYLADNQLSYGSASGTSTVSTLVDTTKNWNLTGVLSAWTGNKVLISDSLGASMETIITSNTTDTLNIGRTVAVGTGTVNTLAYSDNNGVNWIGLGVTIFATTGNEICWSGTRFVAVGAGTNVIAWSNDGITWNANPAATIFSTSGNGICWSGTRFVAVGEGTNSIAWANDGITWNVIALGAGTFTTRGNAIAWNGTRFVAMGEGTNTIIYSIDGVTWAVATNTINTIGKAICWNGSKFVAGGSGTNVVATSTDGITWVAGTTPTLFTSINGIAWNGTRFVAVGTVSSGTNCIAYSTDGVTWTVPTTSIFTLGNGVSWNGTYFIALGTAGTNTIAYSTDGITWTAASTGSLFSTTGRSASSTSPFVSMTPNIGIIPDANTKYKIYDTTGTATGAQSTTQLQDTNKKWKINQWAGSRLLITSGLGQMQEVAIVSNTVNALVFSAITTAPDLTSTYTIVQKPISGLGIQMLWNFGSSDLSTKGRLLYLPRGSGSAMFDIYNISTNRWKIGQYIQGMGEALTTGTMYTYDGKDRIYYQVTTTGRLFYYDIIKNQINPFGTIPYNMSTAIIGNRLEIVTTDDGLSYLYVMRHTGQEMWRTLIMY